MKWALTNYQPIGISHVSFGGVSRVSQTVALLVPLNFASVCEGHCCGFVQLHRTHGTSCLFISRSCRRTVGFDAGQCTEISMSFSFRVAPLVIFTMPSCTSSTFLSNVYEQNRSWRKSSPPFESAPTFQLPCQISHVLCSCRQCLCCCGQLRIESLTVLCVHQDSALFNICAW